MMFKVECTHFIQIFTMPGRKLFAQNFSDYQIIQLIISASGDNRRINIHEKLYY